MAKRRMLLENLISSDDFCDMAHSAQALYLHLNIEADDDGLVGHPSRILRSLRLSQKHLNILKEKGYIIIFESGVIAVRHWLCHNRIRKDRYTPTRYKKEYAMLELSLDESYIMVENHSDLQEKCQPNRNQTAPEVSVEKVSEEKERLIQYSSLNESQVEAENAQCTDALLNFAGGALHTENPLETKKAKSTYSEESAFEEESQKFPPTQKSFTETLTDEQKKKYSKFLNEVRLYFMKEYKTVDSGRFIEYNELRHWRGRNGENVIENYKKYVDEWMKQDYLYVYGK